jgi:hypothetical protein
MRHWRKSYKTYSLGCVVAWAGVLLAVAKRRDHADLQKVGLFCFGWWMGWLSATIARFVYPPPGSAVAPGACTPLQLGSPGS